LRIFGGLDKVGGAVLTQTYPIEATGNPHEAGRFVFSS